jgi:hypothetical protein
LKQNNPNMQWLAALRTMRFRKYWNRPNTVEFFAFVAKAIIIIPGLLFGIQIWWLYIFALVSSLMLIWSSTVKTIPTLIWFNILWSVLATTAIIKHFL